MAQTYHDLAHDEGNRYHGALHALPGMPTLRKLRGHMVDGYTDEAGLAIADGVDLLEVADSLLPRIPLYRVTADRETGEWMDDLTLIGEILKSSHDAMQDTDEVHYDTFEHEGKTCAIEVAFI